MSIIIKGISYRHSNRELLFENLNLSLPKGEKAALIGNNGSGKSTLLKILSGRLMPAEGEFVFHGKPYYVPQHFGQYNETTIAEALGIDAKLEALHRILDGDASEQNFALLDEDWNIEERALAALESWKLPSVSLSCPMRHLSGGEKTKVFLAGIRIHLPQVVLFDEPSNHLDGKGREQLYHLIRDYQASMLVVSHDRTLLNMLHATYELTSHEIKAYGGNYEFYRAEKEKELNALQDRLDEKEKTLRLARLNAIKTRERQQKHDSRGEKKNIKKGTPRIMFKTLKDQAERTSSKLSEVHSGKIQNLADDLTSLRKQLATQGSLKIDIEDARLYSGKILVEAKSVNYGHTDSFLWPEARSFQIRSGERIVIDGSNGSGKTTLIRLILGLIEPQTGEIVRSDMNYLYMDQEYSLFDNALSLYEQVQIFNSRKLLEHELKILLNRLLFPKEVFDKPVGQLSGGEKMRLLICCLQANNNMPDLIILDEPTNNLDIHSLEILTEAIRSYRGTVLLVSHDRYFIEEVEAGRVLQL